MTRKQDQLFSQLVRETRGRTPLSSPLSACIPAMRPRTFPSPVAFPSPPSQSPGMMSPPMYRPRQTSCPPNVGTAYNDSKFMSETFEDVLSEVSSYTQSQSAMSSGIPSHIQSSSNTVPDQILEQFTNMGSGNPSQNHSNTAVTNPILEQLSSDLSSGNPSQNRLNTAVTNPILEQLSSDLSSGNPSQNLLNTAVLNPILEQLSSDLSSGNPSQNRLNTIVTDPILEQLSSDLSSGNPSQNRLNTIVIDPILEQLHEDSSGGNPSRHFGFSTTLPMLEQLPDISSENPSQSLCSDGTASVALPVPLQSRFTGGRPSLNISDSSLDSQPQESSPIYSGGRMPRMDNHESVKLPPLQPQRQLKDSAIILAENQHLKHPSKIKNLALLLCRESIFGDEVLCMSTVTGRQRHPLCPVRLNNLKAIIRKVADPNRQQTDQQFELFVWKGVTAYIADYMKKIRKEKKL